MSVMLLFWREYGDKGRIEEAMCLYVCMRVCV